MLYLHSNRLVPPSGGIQTTSIPVGVPVVAVSASLAHACVTTAQLSVQCWGEGINGALGYGSTQSVASPAAGGAVSVGALALAVSCGARHTCALTIAQQLRCWGSNAEGQLGIAAVPSIGATDVPSSHPPIPLPDATATVAAAAVVAVATAPRTTCVITTSLSVTCWGWDIGRGRSSWNPPQSASTTTAAAAAAESPLPFRSLASSLGAPAVSLAAGSDHVCALTTGLRLRCWGDVSRGALGLLLPALATPQRVGGHTALRSSASPPSLLLLPPSAAGRARVTSDLLLRVTACHHHTCALTAHLQLVCWGGAFSSSPPLSPRLPPIAAAVVRVESCTIALPSATTDSTATTTNSGGDGSAPLCPSAVPFRLTLLAVAVNVTSVRIGVGAAAVTCAFAQRRGTAWLTAVCPAVDSVGTLPVALTTVASLLLPNSAAAAAAAPVTTTTLPLSFLPLPARYATVAAGSAHVCALTAPTHTATTTTTTAATATAVVRCAGAAHANPAVLGSSSSGGGGGVVDCGAPARSLASFYNRACVITTNDQLRCWGAGGEFLGYPFPSSVGGGGGGSTALPPSAAGRVHTGAAVVAVAGGSLHTCVLTTAMRVRCWGAPSLGRLGQGNTIAYGDGSAHPSLASALALGAPALQLACGESHCCAITTALRLRCWGDNSAWQLGIRLADPAPHTSRLPSLTGAVAVASLTATAVSCGNRFTCAVAASSLRVLCWGSSGRGQLGWTRLQQTAAVAVNHPLTTYGAVLALSSGSSHTCALNAALQVVCWGRGDSGQLGMPPPYHDTGTREGNPPLVAATVTQAALAVATGTDFSCALTASRQMQCWGALLSPLPSAAAVTLPPVLPSLETVACSPTAAATAATAAAVPAPAVQSVLFCPALLPFTVTLRLPLSSPLRTAAATDTVTYSLALATATAAPTTTATAAAAEGSVGSTACRFLSVAADSASSSPQQQQQQQRSLVTFDCPPLPLPSPRMRSHGAYAATLSVSVAAAGSAEGRQPTAATTVAVAHTDVSFYAPLSRRPARLSVGRTHACAFFTATQIRCWGSGANGRLGSAVAGDTSLASARRVRAGSAATAVLALRDHSCALLLGGQVRCWGMAARLGIASAWDVGLSDHPRDHAPLPLPSFLADGTTASTASTAAPTPVLLLAGSHNHTCALNARLRVLCWGQGSSGQLGLGSPDCVGVATPLSSAVALGGPAIALSASEDHTCALTHTTAIRCWGSNRYSQLGLPNLPSLGARELPSAAAALPVRALQVLARYRGTCYLSPSMLVHCWGSNIYGLLGSPGADVASPLSARPVQLGVAALLLAGESTHICALTLNLNVRCWGSNLHSALGFPFSPSNPSVGDNEHPSVAAPPSPIATSASAAAVLLSVGIHSACALTAHSLQFVCWGPIAAYASAPSTPLPSSAAPLPWPLPTAAACSTHGVGSCANSSAGVLVATPSSSALSLSLPLVWSSAAAPASLTATVSLQGTPCLRPTLTATAITAVCAVPAHTLSPTSPPSPAAIILGVELAASAATSAASTGAWVALRILDRLPPSSIQLQPVSALQSRPFLPLPVAAVAGTSLSPRHTDFVYHLRPGPPLWLFSHGPPTLRLPRHDTTYTVRLRAIDAHGNAQRQQGSGSGSGSGSSDGAVTLSVTTDLQPPVTTAAVEGAAVVGGVSYTRAPSLTLSLSASEPGCQFVVNIDGSSALSAAGSYTHPTPLPDGRYFVTVRASDAAGNADPSPVQLTVVVDRVAPAIAITSPQLTMLVTTGRRWWAHYSPTVTFTVTADEATSSVVTAVSSQRTHPSGANPRTLSTRNFGGRVLHATVTDLAGNTASRSIRYARVPDTQLLSVTPPLRYGRSSSRRLNFTLGCSNAPGHSTFRYRVDSSTAITGDGGSGGDWVPLSSPLLSLPLPEGSHLIQVAATFSTSSATYYDPAPAVLQWRTDYSAATVTIVSAPPPITASAVATFQLGCSDSACNYRYSIDGGPMQLLTAADFSGGATLTASISSSAPPLCASARYPLMLRSTAVVSSFRYRLRRGLLPWGAWVTLSAPQRTSRALRLSGLRDGNYTVEAQAVTEVALSRPAFHSFAVATRAPSLSLHSTSKQGNSRLFTFVQHPAADAPLPPPPPPPTLLPGASLLYSVDGGATQRSLTPSLTIPSLAAGAHTLTVWPLDAAGNRPPLASSFQWESIGDSGYPTTLRLSDGPPEQSSSSSAHFRFFGAEPSPVVWRVDGRAWQRLPSPARRLTLRSLSQGLHVLEAFAPTERPRLPHHPLPVHWWWEVTTQGSKRGRNTFDTPPLAHGRHTLRAFALDAAGNVDRVGRTFNWTVDTVPPALSLLAPHPPRHSAAAVLSLTLLCSDSSRCTSLRYALLPHALAPPALPSAAAGPFTAAQQAAATAAFHSSRQPFVDAAAAERQPLSLPLPSDGSYVLLATAEDGAGNNVTRLLLAWDTDTRPPRARFGGGTRNGTRFATASPPIRVAADEAHCTFHIRTQPLRTSSSSSAAGEGGLSLPLWVDAALAPAPSASPTSAPPTPAHHLLSLPSLPDGAHLLWVRAVDRVGNTGPSSPPLLFTVDTQPPWLAVSHAPRMLPQGLSELITFSSPPPQRRQQALAAQAGQGGEQDSVRYEYTLFAPSYPAIHTTSWQAVPSDGALLLRPPLPPGAYTLRARATDGAGNTNSSLPALSWIVDATLSVPLPPWATFATHAPALPLAPSSYAALPLRFRWVRPNASAWQYVSATHPAAASASPTYRLALGPWLSDGAHTVEVGVADAALPRPTTTYSFSVDTTAPRCWFQGPLPARTSFATLRFAVRTDEPANLTMRTLAGRHDGSSSGSISSGGSSSSRGGGSSGGSSGGGHWVPFSAASNTTVAAAEEGEHTLQVRAIDNLGNNASSVVPCATHSWVRDTSPPLVELLSSPPAFTTSTRAAFTLRAPAADHTVAFLVQLNAARGWQSILPSAQLHSTATVPAAAGSGTSGSSSSGGDSGLRQSPWTSAQLWLDVGTAGLHTLRLRARDDLGNEQLNREALSHSWVVDLWAPVLPSLEGPSSVTPGATATFRLACDDSPPPPPPAAEQQQQQVPLPASGCAAFRYRVVRERLASLTSCAQQLTVVDWVLLPLPPPRPAAGSPASLRGDATVTIGPLAEGSYQLQVSAVDNAGNGGNASRVHFWRVASALIPELVVTSRVAEVSGLSHAHFSFHTLLRSRPHAVAAFEARLDAAGAWSVLPHCSGGWQCNHTLHNLAEGAHTLQLRVRDEFGNVPAAAQLRWAVRACDGPFYARVQRNGSLTCHRCPHGADCSDRHTRWHTMVAQPGYWTSGSRADLYYACPFDTCIGGSGSNKSRCAPRRVGRLCAACAPGFTAVEGGCLSCDSRRIFTVAATLLAIAGLALTAIAVFLQRTVSALRRAQDSSVTVQFTDTVMKRAKIFVSFAQCLTACTSVYAGLTWPPAFTSFASNLSVVNLDVFSLLGVGCVRRYGFFESFLLFILSPMLLLLVIAVVHALGRVWLHWRLNGLRPRHKRVLLDKCLRLYFWLLLFIYAPVSKRVLQFFHCRTIEYRSFLNADLSIVCGGDEWRRWLPLALTALVVYPVGVPLVFFIVLWRSRRRHSVRSVRRLGFLFKFYRPSLWWWEIGELLRKLFLTGVIIFVLPGRASQIVTGLVACFLAFSAHLQCSPFLSKGEGRLQASALLQLLLVHLMALLLRTDVATADDYGVAQMATALVASSALVCVFALYSATHGLLSSCWARLRGKPRPRRSTAAAAGVGGRSSSTWATLSGQDTVARLSPAPSAIAAAGAASARPRGSVRSVAATALVVDAEVRLERRFLKRMQHKIQAAAASAAAASAQGSSGNKPDRSPTNAATAAAPAAVNAALSQPSGVASRGRGRANRGRGRASRGRGGVGSGGVPHGHRRRHHSVRKRVTAAAAAGATTTGAPAGHRRHRHHSTGGSARTHSPVSPAATHVAAAHVATARGGVSSVAATAHAKAIMAARKRQRAATAAAAAATAGAVPAAAASHGRHSTRPSHRSDGSGSGGGRRSTHHHSKQQPAAATAAAAPATASATMTSRGHAARRTPPSTPAAATLT